LVDGMSFSLRARLGFMLMNSCSRWNTSR
jgi:hypothetical protein